MDEDAQVRPHFVDVFELVMGDYFFENQLNPGGVSEYKTDVPSRCGLYDGLDALAPIGEVGDGPGWFVVAFDPFRAVKSNNPAEVSYLVCSDGLKLGTAAHHEHFFPEEGFWDREGGQVQEHFSGPFFHGLEHFFGDRDVFTGAAGGAAAEGIVGDNAGPGDIRFVFQSILPPLLIQVIVGMDGYLLLESGGKLGSLK